MAVPFPEAQLEALIYMALGALLSLTIVLGVYAQRLKKRLEGTDEEPGIRIDRMGLSLRAEEVLETVMEEPMLQSELPSELKVSKATISNAVSELFERNLVRKKKKANTYLIEPRMDKIEEQAR
ncbi:MAG: helix-turn-helix transcriptional regulator [Candidatus Nanohaloarchaea archaeon]